MLTFLDASLIALVETDKLRTGKADLISAIPSIAYLTLAILFILFIPCFTRKGQ